MATIATRTKLAIVNIVSLVTDNTGTWGAVDNFYRISMAAITVYLGVLAIQFKLRLGIVIEAPDFPAVGCVAAIAI